MLITLQPVGFCQFLETWGLNCVLKQSFAFRISPLAPERGTKTHVG